MIAVISQEHFFKCQKSIERQNLTQPSKKILVMDCGTTDQTSHTSGLLLKAYYTKLEKNPKLGLSDLDFHFLIKNHLNDKKEISCYYCNKHIAEQDITIDHFKPKVFKGANQYFNIKLSCKNCNESKGGIYPQRMPITFKLFLSKVHDNKKYQCLDILIEAKEHCLHLMDETEISLLNRLILMELKWRSDYRDKKAAKNLDEAA
jgi:hypothetical protein